MIFHHTLLFIAVKDMIIGIFLKAFSVNSPVAGWQLKREGRMEYHHRQRLNSKQDCPGAKHYSCYSGLRTPLGAACSPISHEHGHVEEGPLGVSFLAWCCLDYRRGYKTNHLKLGAERYDLVSISSSLFVLPSIDCYIADVYPCFLRWNIIDMFFAVTVASLLTLNALIPTRHGRSSGGTFIFTLATSRSDRSSISLTRHCAGSEELSASFWQMIKCQQKKATKANGMVTSLRTFLHFVPVSVALATNSLNRSTYYVGLIAPFIFSCIRSGIT